MNQYSKNGLVVLLVLAFGAGCGGGNLSEDEARRLVEAQPDFAAPTCSVPVLVHIDPNDMFRDDGRYFVHYADCARALEAAHMGVRAGECVGSDCEILLDAPARPEGNNLLLPCATSTLTAVRDIATTGNEADFRYERDVEVNAGADVAARTCDFRLPETGPATRERHARRDDAGNWSLVAATR